MAYEKAVVVSDVVEVCEAELKVNPRCRSPRNLEKDRIVLSTAQSTCDLSFTASTITKIIILYNVTIEFTLHEKHKIGARLVSSNALGGMLIR